MAEDQDALYKEAAAQWGGALQRLARSCEAEPERRRDLLQDMHVALWKSFAVFDGRCSLRTWVYRVASNAAATHVQRERRDRSQLVALDTLENLPAARNDFSVFEEADVISRLYAFIRQLKEPDRQVMTLYLEGLNAEAIGEVTGLSAGAIATRISRAKTLLARLFHEAAHV